MALLMLLVPNESAFVKAQRKFMNIDINSLTQLNHTDEETLPISDYEQVRLRKRVIYSI